MNTYSKYCAGVFLAKCDDEHNKGDVIEVVTRNGKVNRCIVYNKIYEQDSYYYYSIVRADDYNIQKRAQKIAEKYRYRAETAEQKQRDYYGRAYKDIEFLKMGEPIKVGHHSEGRHRNAIEGLNSNMKKSVEYEEKATQYEDKSEYWESKTGNINLSMPESLQYFTDKLNEAIEYRDGLKSKKIKMEHALSLQYANKHVKELREKRETAKLLWE